MSGRRHDLEEVDRALVALRRFLAAPGMIDDGGARVELSTLLVLDAVVEGDAVRVRDVAARLDVAHSTASRLVARAERAGAVTRRPSPEDARETLVVPTAPGRELHGRAAAFRLGRLDRITRDWQSAEVTALARALSRFVESAAASS